MTVFNGLPETEFQPFGELSDLILGNARHDDQPELTVRIQGIDIVVLEQHAHIVFQQFLGVLDAVQRGAGKPGNLFGNDKVKQPRPGIPDHPVEILPFFRGAAGDALVDVPRHEGPVGLALDQLRIILHLILQRIDLFLLIGGHPGVEGHPQREVENRPPHSKFRADFTYFH